MTAWAQPEWAHPFSTPLPTPTTPFPMITVFDIETAPDQDAIDRLADPFKKEYPVATPFDPASVKLGNIKDQAKIDEKIAAAEVAHKEAYAAAVAGWESDQLDHYAKIQDKAAIYPALSTICAIGWQSPGSEPVLLQVGDNVADEKALVQNFIQAFYATSGAGIARGGSSKWGFWSGNSNAHQQFDLNHILWACMRHGLNAPGELHPYTKKFVDLAEPFFMYGPLTPRMDGYPSYLGLNRAAELLGLHGTVADSYTNKAGETVELVVADKDELAVDGANYHRWLAAGAFETARGYLLNDLVLTRAVAERHPFLS